jgi:coproporphyrinogen III oxidase
MPFTSHIVWGAMVERDFLIVLADLHAALVHGHMVQEQTMDMRDACEDIHFFAKGIHTHQTIAQS